MSNTLEEHRKLGKYLTINGIKIFTIDVGKGDTIVLLPGFFGTSFSFRKVIPILSKNYRVLSLDYPGIGFSEKSTTPYSHRYLSEILYQWIDELTKERIHLVVHDYAGPISFLLLNAYPEKIKTLSLVSSYIHLTKLNFYFPLSILNKRFIGNYFAKLLNPFLIKWIFNKKFLDNSKPMEQEIAEDYSFLLLNGENRINFLHMCQSVDRTIYAQRDMESGLKKMIGGRQIIVGENCKIINEFQTEYVKEMMRLGIINMMPGKHFLMEDYPEIFSEKIEMLVKKFSKNNKQV